MTSHLRPALVLFLLLTLLTGAIYPGLITVIAQGLFPRQANGSVLSQGDQVIGSELIGQYFDKPAYFWGRPSGTSSSSFPYDASSSTGSNLGPTNPDLLKAIDVGFKNHASWRGVPSGACEGCPPARVLRSPCAVSSWITGTPT